MSLKCNSIAFKIRAVAVTEAQSYLFPSVASGCLKTPVSNKWPYKICKSKYTVIAKNYDL